MCLEFYPFSSTREPPTLLSVFMFYKMCYWSGRLKQGREIVDASIVYFILYYIVYSVIVLQIIDLRLLPFNLLVSNCSAWDVNI